MKFLFLCLLLRCARRSFRCACSVRSGLAAFHVTQQINSSLCGGGVRGVCERASLKPSIWRKLFHHSTSECGSDSAVSGDAILFGSIEALHIGLYPIPLLFCCCCFVLFFKFSETLKEEKMGRRRDVNVH